MAHRIDGFDGFDLVALEVPDAAPLTALYVDLLGFEVVADHGADDPGTDEAGALVGREVRRMVELGRSGGVAAGVGGGLLLLETGCAPGGPVGAPTGPGPYALDFYLRDAEATETAIAEAGWDFTSPAVHYALPGTPHPVREHMLVQPHSGLLHALVQHRPGRTRSVLGDDGTGTSSEVVAVVVLTDDLDGARRFARDMLGGREYFAGVFDGPAVEEMLQLGPGHGLDAALFRGPTSANARLEFARPVGPDGPVPLGTGGGIRPLTAPVLVTDDLDGLTARIEDGGHGTVTARHHLTLAGRRRRAVRVETVHDVVLSLVEGLDGSAAEHGRDHV